MKKCGEDTRREEGRRKETRRKERREVSRAVREGSPPLEPDPVGGVPVFVLGKDGVRGGLRSFTLMFVHL